MHISEMESTTIPFENYAGQSRSEIHARAELAGRQSNYMTNMILPEIVKSSKNFPLGPDCVITRDSEPDETVLVNMDLYWLISLERGCVELKVLVCEAHSGSKAITHDPRVIVTRKPRRFEAYCCAVCRQNFVTVVQALLHMKAFHRQSKKILIQDQNVFHDIDKAMEVPPIPLPWYVAKRVNEQNLQVGPSTAGVPTVNTTSSEAALNPVTMLLQAIGKEYGKPVHTVLFGKGLSDVKIQFDDKSSIVAHLPDLANAEVDGKTELNSNDKLEFHVRRVKGENEHEDSCVVRANNPALAQKLIDMALKQGVTHGSGTELAGQDCSMNKDGEKFMKPDAVADDRISDSPSQYLKLDSRGRPSKTVRFMLGAPDSDEDGSSSASERLSGRDSMSPTTSAMEKDVTSQPEVAKPTTPSSDDQKSKEDEGLQGVVNQLISTDSKGVIFHVEPESPVLSVASSSTAGKREELIATASLHVKYMPKHCSVPTFPSIGMPVSVGPPSPTVIPSLGAGMVRTQSWGGGGASNPLRRFSLSAYTPSTPQSFDHMTRDELCKSFLTVGRSFTYAEKIKLMNKLNDEDALITQEHVKGAGRLLEAEASRQEKSRVAPPSTSVIQQTFEKPRSSTVVSAIIKAKHIELKTVNSKVRNQQYTGADLNKRRRSKYDVDRLIIVHDSEVTSEHGNKRPLAPAVEGGRSSSEGSLSDKDDYGGGEIEDKDENPPTLLDVLRTNLVKTGFSTPSCGQSTSQHIPTSYPSILSDSEYYGSGEWAIAAMQTLRNLQTKVYISPPEKPEKPEYKNSTEDDSDSRSTSPFVNIYSGVSNGADAITTPFVPTTPSTKTDTSAVDAIMALAQQMSADQSCMTHLPKPEELPKVRSQRKRSLSPLLTEEEKELIRSRASTDSTERSNKKAKKEMEGWQWHGVMSEMNSNNRKKASASSSKRRTSESTSKPSFVIAEKGDIIEFTESLTGTLLDESNEVTMRFCKGTSAGSDGGVDELMDMPQLCTKSIETLMKVRYVEKIIRCRVCGFSVVLNDDSNGSAMKSHVMEHSLKELLQAECNGKQFI